MQRKQDTQREIPIAEKQTEDRPQQLTDLNPDELALVAAGSGSHHVKWYEQSGWQ
jgi:hypothetical protein